MAAELSGMPSVVSEDSVRRDLAGLEETILSVTLILEIESGELCRKSLHFRGKMGETVVTANLPKSGSTQYPGAPIY